MLRQLASFKETLKEQTSDLESLLKEYKIERIFQTEIVIKLLLITIKYVFMYSNFNSNFKMFNDVNLLSFNASSKEKYTTLLMEKLFTVEERCEGYFSFSI